MASSDESMSTSGGSVPDLDDDESIRSLVKGALGDAEAAPDVLPAVQKKLFDRSRGKFYRDAWSTSKEPPVGTYLGTSALMLAISLALYAALAWTAGEPAPLERSEPKPVNVVGPRR